MADELAEAMNEAVVRRLAGEAFYQRGLRYFLQGHVQSVWEIDGGLEAVVSGTRDYTVRLTAEEGILDYSCTCPVGDDGLFCKHCVAAALAWLSGSTGAGKGQDAGAAEAITISDAGRLLREEKKEKLVEMILAWARRDARLHERLLIWAARRSGPETAIAAARRAFEAAVAVDGYVPYRDAADYARGVEEAVDLIEDLLEDGQAAAVVELTESCLRSLVDSMGMVDDSDGYVGGICYRLQQIHYQACVKARPKPEQLARRLFRWESQGTHDMFSGAVIRYAEILGEKGLEVYRKLAKAEWDRMPPRGADEDDMAWGRRYAITRIMESLARLSGDVEQLVAVMSRNLSHPSCYLRIAETYRDAGDHDKALRWAEKGLKAFRGEADSELREFVAEEYHRRGRHEEAMKLVWDAFRRWYSADGFRNLKRHAAKAGALKEWRERGLEEIRNWMAKVKQGGQAARRARWFGGEIDHSILVAIFLDEGDVETAWKEAQEGGCSEELWLQLAEAREKEHPEDAAPIYMRQAEATLARVRNSRYYEPVGLLEKAAAVMQRIGKNEEFTRYLEGLRVKHKRKRNFIKLLDEKRDSLYLQ